MTYQYNNNINNNENTKQTCLTTIRCNENDMNVYTINKIIQITQNVCSKYKLIIAKEEGGTSLLL